MNNDTGYGTYLVSKRIAHHGSHSGYGRLPDFLGSSSKEIPVKRAGFLARGLFGKVYQQIGKSWYSASSLDAEIRVLLKCCMGGRNLYHFMYGEDDFRFAGLGRNLNRHSRIVATYHQPPSVLEKILQDREHLKSLDAVIVVGANQSVYFEEIPGKERVFHVPNGVDTGFFRPGPGADGPAHEKTCLFVGQWLRDFVCLRDVIRRVHSKDRNVKFTVITTETGRQTLKGLENTTVQVGVPDDALLASYQSSDLLVLPLIDSTANCAILEAMASGLPVVTSNVGGVGGYVDDKCALLSAAGNAAEMAAHVTQLLLDDNLRARMGFAAREKALREFDSRIIAGKIRDVHREIMNTPQQRNSCSGQPSVF